MLAVPCQLYRRHGRRIMPGSRVGCGGKTGRRGLPGAGRRSVLSDRLRVLSTDRAGGGKMGKGSVLMG